MKPVKMQRGMRREMGTTERWGMIGWKERRSVCTGVNWGTEGEWKPRMKRKGRGRDQKRGEPFRVKPSCLCLPAGRFGDPWRFFYILM